MKIFTTKNVKSKILILTTAAVLLSCASNQSWLIEKNRERSWTTLALLGVQIERSGGWDSVEREAASLAPLYFWDLGCKVVPAEEEPKYAARIWITERDFNLGWKSTKSLAVEVHIWAFEDAPANGEPVEKFKLPASVGRVVMTGEKSFSSSDVMGKLLSKAITQAVKQLSANKGKKNA